LYSIYAAARDGGLARESDLAQWERSTWSRTAPRWTSYGPGGKTGKAPCKGTGGKDVELGRQVIKKLLSTPVFAHPTEAGAWEWTAVGADQTLR